MNARRPGFQLTWLQRRQQARRVAFAVNRARQLRATAPPAGHLRGIDYYDDDRLVRALMRSHFAFRRRHGRWPRLEDPQSFNDKLYAAKFFMPMEVPTLADKGRVAEAIPPAFAGQVLVLPIAWHANSAELPADGALPAGGYWLKASHGSAMNLKLEWPPSAAVRAQAEARGIDWLETEYGTDTGEWWYATGTRGLLLSPEVAPAGSQAFDYKFEMLHGRIRYLLVAFDLPDGRRARSFFDPVAALQGDWVQLPVILLKSANPPAPPPDALATMCTFALAVGARYAQIRVDLLQAPGGPVYLTELTYCDMDALGTFDPPSFERALGADWDISSWYPR